MRCRLTVSSAARRLERLVIDLSLRHNSSVCRLRLALLATLCLASCQASRNPPESSPPSRFRIRPQGPDFLGALERPVTLDGRSTVTLGENQEVLAGASQATLAIWARPASASREPQDLIAISIGGGHAGNASRASLRLLPTGALSVFGRTDDSTRLAREVHTEAGAVLPGRWTQVTAVFDFARDAIHVYLDGRLVHTVADPPQFSAKMTPDTPSDTIAVGSEDDGSAFFFHGELAHVGIWRRILSKKEMRKLIDDRPK